MSGGRLLTVVGIRAAARSDVESWSAPGDPRDLRDTFAGWAPEVAALVGAADRVHRWSLYDREPLDRWGADGVTLLGDAAHPMLPHHGQGASQAIEDAVALAHHLAAAPGDPAGALRRHELLRLPHTRAVQLGSRGGGSMRVGARQGGGLGAVVEDVSWIQRYDVEAALAELVLTAHRT